MPKSTLERPIVCQSGTNIDKRVPTWTPKRYKHHQKSSPPTPAGNYRILGAKMSSASGTFGEPFLFKIHRKCCLKFKQESNAEKSEIDAKRLPKWSRNQCQNSSRINVKTGTEQIMRIMKIHVFLWCKNMQIQCKGHSF